MARGGDEAVAALFDVFFQPPPADEPTDCGLVPVGSSETSGVAATNPKSGAPVVLGSGTGDGKAILVNSDTESEGGLGFEIDVKADESKRVRPNPRVELARLKRKRFVLSDDEVAEATDGWRIEGTSTCTQKRFTRLTTTPRPDDVRPEGVLRDALHKCCQEWAARRDWPEVSEQLRAIRQDLMVQRLRTPLAVRTYEVCARFALEAGDMRQFQQVQFQLAGLHKDGIVAEDPGGQVKDGAAARREFACYRIVYLGMQGLRGELADALQGLSPEDRASPEVRFALCTLSAAQSGNWARFFKLVRSESAPHRTPELVAALAGPLRLRLLAAVCRAFPQGLHLSRAATWLQQSWGECRDLIQAHGGKLTAGTWLDTRGSEEAFRRALA